MKRNLILLLTLSALLLALAGPAQARETRKYSLADLFGTWNLTQVQPGGTYQGYVTFAKSGKLLVWSLGNTTHQPVSGRLSVSKDGQITGILRRTINHRDKGITWHQEFRFNLAFTSSIAASGSVLRISHARDNATGRPNGMFKRTAIQWTLAKPLQGPVRRPK